VGMPRIRWSMVRETFARHGTIGCFNRWVIDVLDASNTPLATKQRANALLSV
jgi:hypothetical protein